MTEESELMLILKRRKELTDLHSSEQDDKVNQSDGGQLYKIIKQSEHVNDIDPEDESVVLRRNYSNLYGNQTQLNRDSYSSVNSRLSGMSSSLQSSFSSNSDGEILLKKNAVKLKAKDSLLISNTRRRKKFVNRNSSPPECPTQTANRSFLWSRAALASDDLHKTNSTTSVDSSSSDQVIYYSFDESDKSCESLENVNTYSDVLTLEPCENGFESLYFKNLDKNIEGLNISDKESSDYVELRRKDTSDYDSDSNEFGFSHSDNSSGNRRIVSAINKNISVDGCNVELPAYLDNVDADGTSADNEKYDTTTIVSDEYGSEQYEDLESTLKDQAINIFPEPPTESKIDKYQRRLKGRVNELVQTEENYVSKLDRVVNDYKNAFIGDVDGIPLTLVPLLPDQIFSNIEDLRDFHRDALLPALQNAGHNFTAVGKAFVDNEIKFRIYIRYSRDNKKCIRNVIEHKHFFHMRQTELDHKLDLSCYLLEPIQRIPRYMLFLDDMIKTMKKQEEEVRADSGIGLRTSVASYGSSMFYESINFEDFPLAMKEDTGLDSLQDAKNMIDKLLRKVDDTVAIENIKGCLVSLREQGELLRQDEFNVTDGFKRKFQMRCFLFEKAVIFTVISKKHVMDEVFEYHDLIEMKDLGLTPPPEEECTSAFTVWYKKRNNKPFVMDGDVNVKKVWVKDISALLWEQARNDKEKIKSCASRKTSTVLLSKEPSESDFVEVSSDMLASVSTRLPGEQCTSSRKTMTKRKLRKKKVNNDIPDTLTFVGRNMNVIWSSLR